MWGFAEWLVVTPHLLLAAVAAAVTAGAWLVSLRAPGRPRAGAEPDVDGLAYLAGGPQRVVEVALARLVQAGALEARPGARVRPRRADAGLPDEAPVLDRRLLHAAGRDGSIARLLAAHTGDPEVTAARARLAEAGLVGAPEAAEHRRRARRTLVTLTEVCVAATLLVFAGLLVGIARTGTSPVSFGVLGVAVTATAAVGVLAWAVDPRPTPRFRTAAGLRALAGARRATTSRARERRVALSGLAVEVPLGWRGGWWRARHVLVRLVPVAAVAAVAAATAGVLDVVARLS